MFSVGEFVVKPNTGICEITEITEMEMRPGERKLFYVLHPIDDLRAKLYVTVDATVQQLRLAMSREEAQAFIESIPEIEAAWIENEKLREQRYKDALRSNDPANLIAIIKNMYFRGKERLAAGKKITATDDKYFQQAEGILYSELAFSLGIERCNIKTVISETIEHV